MSKQELPFHEVANLFPQVEGQDFDDLKADIAANGLREPVWTYRGKIIDGRNRYRACRELGIEPRLREWDGGGSLVAFIVSLNLHRRHLTSSQRAAVAAELLPLLEAEAKERQRRAGRENGRGRRARDGKVPQNVAGVDGEARGQAAKVAGTNRQYVSQAKRLRAEAPDLFERVKAGGLKVTQASQELRRRQERERQGREHARLLAEQQARQEQTRQERQLRERLAVEVLRLPEFVAAAESLARLERETRELEIKNMAEMERLQQEIELAGRRYGTARLGFDHAVQEEVNRRLRLELVPSSLDAPGDPAAAGHAMG